MKTENSPTFPDPYRPIVYWFFAFVFGFFLTMATAGAGPIPPEYKELHILNRLGFGPTPSDLAHIRAIGVDRYIDEQLSPRSIPLTKALDSKLEGLSTLRMSAP